MKLTRKYEELSAGKLYSNTLHSVNREMPLKHALEGLPGLLNRVADFFRCSTRTLVISCVLTSVISGNTVPSPSTLQQKATDGDYVDVLAQIYKLPVSKLRHSHHLVVGAVDVSCDFNQHFRSETWEDRLELNSEPRNPVRGLQFLNLHLDDYEGSVHHHVSHGRADIRKLQKHKTRTVSGTVRAHRTLGYPPWQQRNLCRALSLIDLPQELCSVPSETPLCS